MPCFLGEEENFYILDSQQMSHFTGHKSITSAASLGLCRFVIKSVASLHEATRCKAAADIGLCRLCRLCRERSPPSSIELELREYDDRLRDVQISFLKLVNAILTTQAAQTQSGWEF